MEEKIVRVTKELEFEEVSNHQIFGWEIKNKHNVNNIVIIKFYRSKQLNNYAKIVSLENDYYSIKKPNIRNKTGLLITMIVSLIILLLVLFMSYYYLNIVDMNSGVVIVLSFAVVITFCLSFYCFRMYQDVKKTNKTIESLIHSYEEKRIEILEEAMTL